MDGEIQKGEYKAADDGEINKCELLRDILQLYINHRANRLTTSVALLLWWKR